MNGHLKHYVLARSWQKSCLFPMVD